jgi:hypothetical protein
MLDAKVDITESIEGDFQINWIFAFKFHEFPGCRVVETKVLGMQPLSI